MNLFAKLRERAASVAPCLAAYKVRREMETLFKDRQKAQKAG